MRGGRGLPTSPLSSSTANGSCVEEENVHAFIFNAKFKSLVNHFLKFLVDSKFIFINSTLESDGQNSDGNNFSLQQNNLDFIVMHHVSWISDFVVSNSPYCPSKFSGECIPKKDHVIIGESMCFGKNSIQLRLGT